jgi:hypothetical protein
MRRAGASTFPYKTEQLIKGNIDFPEYVQSVLTPSIGLTTGMEVYMGRDPRTGKRLSPAEIAKNSIAPVSQTSRMASGDRDPAEFVESLAGISKQYSDAERLAKRYMGQQVPEGDPETADQRKMKRHIVDKMRKGKDLSNKEQAAYDDLPDKKRDDITKDAKMTPMQAVFSHLSMEHAVRVWNKASEKERDELFDLYQKHINNYMKAHPEDAEQLNQRIDEAEDRKL